MKGRKVGRKERRRGEEGEEKRKLKEEGAGREGGREERRREGCNDNQFIYRSWWEGTLFWPCS